MNGADFKVDQLFCFPAVSNDCSQKIQQLHQIIPLSLISRNAYSPYYFYERPGITNPLNYYIVTPHYLLQISPDHATAQLQRDSHLISHFSQYFQNLLTHCDLLVFAEANVFDALQRYNDTANPNGLQFMMLQPCFGRYFAPEMIGKYLQ
ncbi:MAG: hypothetical protein LJU34_04985, partial [Oscillospiraceae bacterium]|nr:hypothetical protein [Oscillospiraceae bacterium]